MHVYWWNLKLPCNSNNYLILDGIHFCGHVANTNHNITMVYSLCTYQCKSRGGGVRARGRDLMPETIPPVGLLIVRSDPGVGTFDFDWQKPGINSEAVTTLLEKGVKVSFVLIAIIRYFKLSSKQIMSILRKFLSSSSHLILKLDWNRIPPWKSEDFLWITGSLYTRA